jgi:hypothetical protein
MFDLQADAAEHLDIDDVSDMLPRAAHPEDFDWQQAYG